MKNIKAFRKTCKNLDAMVKPIVNTISLIKLISKDIEKEHPLFYPIKKINNQLDRTLDIIGDIFQEAWVKIIFGNNEARKKFIEQERNLERVTLKHSRIAVKLLNRSHIMAASTWSIALRN